MNKRKRKVGIMAGSVVLFAGLVAGGLGLLGLLPWQSGGVYEDPQGRFTIEVAPSWEQIETNGSYTQFKIPDPPMNLYLLVLKASTVEEGFSQAFEVVGFDLSLLSGGVVTSLAGWQLYARTDSAMLDYGLAGQLVGEDVYVFMVKTDQPNVGVENAAVMRALTSLKIAGKQEIVIKSFADLEDMLRSQVDRLAGSVSVALLYQDQIVYTYVYGEANPVEGIRANTQTIYQFGSMTKPFTASALMQLVEEGRVDLDAWPGEYIPEFPERWNVTVRQLLAHSACMPDPLRLTRGLIALPGESFAPLEEIFTAYTQDYPDLVCEPGKASQYANSHYLALARIIEEVSGEPYETYVIDHLLTPLEMGSSHFQLVEADERYTKGQIRASDTDENIARLNEYRGPGQEDLVLQKGESFSTLVSYRILPPWGGLRGTPGDVTHFLQMQMNGGRYGDTQILQPETAAAMQEMQLSTSGSPLGFGLSWWIGEDDNGVYYYHGGGAPDVENMMRFYPNLKLGVVVMGSVTGYHADQIADGLVSAWMREK